MMLQEGNEVMKKAKKSFFQAMDFDQCPFVVLWELTRACDLVCKHCRAEAIPSRDPNELSTQEAFQVVDQIRQFHDTAPIIIVLTGGDPLRRPDLFEIIAYSASKGLRTTITPSGTPFVKFTDLEKMKSSGLHRVAVSLDGSNAKIHDEFRGVAGSFDSSIQILKWAASCGIETQINTTITRYNLDDFDNLARLGTDLGIALWSVFFLVPTGRGSLKDSADAKDYEKIFEKMVALAKSASFDIKSTAAPQYRRVLVQQQVKEKKKHKGGLTQVGFESAMAGNRSRKGVNDGNGILFISHTGEVYPSGFLPVSGGNLRKENLVHIYRESKLFKDLRDYTKISGKCGACEFRPICGGSRARAYGVYGDYLASDPFCVHIPKTYKGEIQIAQSNDFDALLTGLAC
jgi:radical SAM protein